MYNKEYDYWNATNSVEIRKCDCGQTPLLGERDGEEGSIYTIECLACGSGCFHIEICEVIKYWNKMNMAKGDMIRESARILEESTKQ